ncbi:hypothetical protein P167DRAFT_540013 [Morchella conica CCBAS932]|uniref:Uncharacterized protein n=1 Tax=Morchella conica CCBAS932 TaxID=1392247 RepID=A0A3N4KDN5_9PEZI|nr:hypothetical protein P167DRAFT_540013 [Morchella conica CCBAS932]
MFPSTLSPPELEGREAAGRRALPSHSMRGKTGERKEAPASTPKGEGRRCEEVSPSPTKVGKGGNERGEEG